MLLLDITIVNVALPDIQRDLDASLSDLQWVIDAYALTLAALLLTAGSLADRYGRKRLFAIGTVVFTVGSLLCGARADGRRSCRSRGPSRASAARSCSPPRWRCSSSAFRGRDRGTAFGVFGATTGVAVAVGPVLGGVLTSGLSWRWIFFVNIPIGVLALAVTLHQGRGVPRPARRAGSTGSASCTFSSGARRCWSSALIRGGATGWGDAAGRQLLRGARRAAGGVRGQPARCRSSRCSTSALLRKPTFVGGLVAAFGVSASVFSLLTYLVIYVQNVLGYSAVEAGVRFLFLSGMSFVAAIVAGRLTSHVPTKWLIAPGLRRDRASGCC